LGFLDKYEVSGAVTVMNILHNLPLIDTIISYCSELAGENMPFVFRYSIICSFTTLLHCSIIQS